MSALYYWAVLLELDRKNSALVRLDAELAEVPATLRAAFDLLDRVTAQGKMTLRLWAMANLR